MSEHDYDNWYIRVVPRGAGWFGNGAFVSGMSYTERQTKALQNQIIQDIQRHVDNVVNVEVVYVMAKREGKG